MTNKQKYRKAAQLISKYEQIFACHALKAVNLSSQSFKHNFKPRSGGYAFFSEEVFVNKQTIRFTREEDRLARSLALLFMAEMEN